MEDALREPLINGAIDKCFADMSLSRSDSLLRRPFIQEFVIPMAEIGICGNGFFVEWIIHLFKEVGIPGIECDVHMLQTRQGAQTAIDSDLKFVAACAGNWDRQIFQRVQCDRVAESSLGLLVTLLR